MSYTPQTWVDGPQGGTPLSAARLTHIESGVQAAAATADAALPGADGSVTTAKLAAGAVTSAKIADGTIVDADVSASAAIAVSKVSGALVAASNLSDLANAATSRQNLGAQRRLTNTGTKTTTYTAADGDFVLADATSGAFNVTLPAANVSGQVLAVKKIDSSANAVTVLRAGSDTINAASTSVALSLQDEVLTFTSNGAGQWWVSGGQKSLGSLDARYAPVVGSTTYGRIGDNLTGHKPFMRHWVKACQNIVAATPTRVKWLETGDSMAGFKNAQILPLVKNIIGQTAAGYALGTTTNNATSGTITANTTDYAAWFNGSTYSFATGASRTYGQGGTTFTCDTIKVYYIKDGGGTFKLQTNGVDEASYTNVATTGTGDLGIITLSKVRAAYNVTVVNLTGTVKIVGVSFEDSTISGLMQIGTGVSGYELASTTTQGWANFGAFVADLQPTVITNEMRETDVTDLPANIAKWATAIGDATAADVLVFAQPPHYQDGTGSDPQITTQNGYWAAAADTHGWIYVDSWTPCKDYATINALGWMNADGIHPVAALEQFLVPLIMRDLGLMDVYGLPFARSILPQTITLGTGMATLYGNSTTDLTVRQFNSTAYGDLQVRTIQQPIVAQAATSGNVTIDTTVRGHAKLTLNGNVGTVSLSTPANTGCIVIVEVIQGAGGPYTITAWQASIKFPGGAAPTLSSTVGGRDIFYFMYDAGSYICMVKTSDVR